MSDLLFSKNKWNEALVSLIDSAKVFVPVAEGEYHTFKPLEQGMTPDFTFQNTRLSPKSLVLPQSERMFEYNLDPEDENAHIRTNIFDFRTLPLEIFLHSYKY